MVRFENEPLSRVHDVLLSSADLYFVETWHSKCVRITYRLRHSTKYFLNMFSRRKYLWLYFEQRFKAIRSKTKIKNQTFPRYYDQSVYKINVDRS